MGKFVNYVRNEKRFILSLVLMILGIAFGDASVLMAEGVTVAPPAPEGGTATEGHEGLQTQLGGQDTSVTTLERGGETGDIIAEDIDEDIAKFRPDFFPIDTIARKAAKKKRKTNYVVKHYNIDASRITCITNAEHTESASKKRVALPIDAADGSVFNVGFINKRRTISNCCCM